MKYIQYFLIALLFALCWLAGFSQADTSRVVKVAASAPASGILGFLGNITSGGWLGIIASLYEIIVRRAPTQKNLSLFAILGRIIDFIIPNNIQPPGGTVAQPNTFPKAGP